MDSVSVEKGHATEVAGQALLPIKGTVVVNCYAPPGICLSDYSSLRIIVSNRHCSSSGYCLLSLQKLGLLFLRAGCR